MKLLPKQEHLVYYLRQPQISEIIYGGAAGGGKTQLLALIALEYVTKYPGCRVGIGRKKLKTLKLTTLKTLFDTMRTLGIPKTFYNYNQQSDTITFGNGSEIVLINMFYYPTDPDFDSFGSLELTIALVDEVAEVMYKAWQVLSSRVRYKLFHFGVTNKIVGTCNPTKRWAYGEFYNLHTKGELPEHRRFVQALPKDNIHLPQSYLDQLLRLDENSKQRLYYGNWEYDDDPSTLIDHSAIEDYFDAHHVRPEGAKYITADIARKGKDSTVIRVWHGWLCIARIKLDKALTQEVVDRIRKLQFQHGIPNSRVVTDEDGVGGGVTDILRCNGFVNNKSAMNGENYANLKSQCHFHMARMITDRLAGEICLDTDVKDRITKEMEQVKQDNLDKDGKLSVVKKEVVIQNIQRSPDDWDSIAMRYYFELIGNVQIIY